MKKLSRSALSLILSFLLIIGVVPVGVIKTSAESNDEIYYSDIIFAYSAYIAENDYLNYYISENEACFKKIKEDFMDSPKYILMSVKEGMQSLNLKDYFRAASDALGDTNYTYEAALDKANVAFAEKMLNVNSNASQKIGVINNLSKNTRKVATAFDKIEKFRKANNPDNASIVSYMITALKEVGLLNRLPAKTITSLENALIAELPKVLKFTVVANDVMNAVKAFISFLIVEEMRFEIIDDILAATSSGAVYDGMSRLESQLKLGFVTYFLSTYVDEKIFGKIMDYAEDIVLNNIFGNYGTAFSVVSVLCDIGSLIVFDGILDVADMDELTSQMVLAQYSKEFGQMVKSRSRIFGEYSFSYDDVVAFENLFLGLGASTDAAYEASEPLIYDNVTFLHKYRDRYKECGVFNKTMNAVKDDLLALPKSERIRTNVDTFYFRNEVSILKATPSDIIEENTYYCVDGYFNSNVNVPGSLTIPVGEFVEIRGYLKSYDGGSVNIDGVLTVTGDMELKAGYSSASYSHLNMNKPGALLVLEDDFISASSSCCNLSAGTIRFSGFENIQTVTGLSAYNILVLNPLGIKYNSDVRVKGSYNLNGYTLDNDGYSTYIDANSASFDSVSDFKNVYLGCNYELLGDITANIYVNAYNLTVPEKADVIVNGNISVANYRSVTVDGKMTVTGNMHFDTWYGSNEYGSLVMNRENSVLTIGGDIEFKNRNGSKISNGTIIFEGYNPQRIVGLSAKNITVNNPNGIILGSDLHLKGHFDLNFNPVEIGSNMIYVAENTASFDKDSDFKKISLLCYYDLPCDVTADIFINNYGITVPQNKDVTVNGNISVSDYGQLEVEGILTLTGDINIKSSYGGSVYGDFIMESEDAIFAIGGNLIFDSSNSSQITNGTVIFCGSVPQRVAGIKPHNITVTNPEGIVYGGNMYVSGHYDLNSNPVDFSNYNTYVNSDNTTFDTESYFGNVRIERDFILNSSVNANIFLFNHRSLTIPKDADITIGGNYTADPFSTTKLDGKLYVKGDMNLKAGYGSKEYASFVMTEKDSLLKIDGDLIAGSSKCCSLTDGKVILTGTELQKVELFYADTLVSENESGDGVNLYFCNVSNLFQHNGNKFTESYTTFTDYDGDGVKDNLDSAPTVGLPCTINANVNDEVFGNISETEINTVGGTVHTLTATPDKKYEFVKWVDSVGNDVSFDVEFTFVAKTDNTYTAVFQKRSKAMEFDYNDDGVVDILDLVLLTEYLLQNELDSFCDFNDDDGILEAADLVKVKKYIFENF